VESVEKRLREEARRLLAEKKVDYIVGYEMGTLPLVATPCLITEPEDAERLVWNALCLQNPAKYVHDLITQHKNSQKRVKVEDRTKKIVGVVARGCTSRSLILHLQERQYDRDEVFVIGVPCTGYVDRKKLAARLGGEEILEGTITGSDLVVKTAAGSSTVPVREVLADNCLVCRFNNPLITDMMIGEPAPPMDPEGEYKEIEAFEQLSETERWAYFTKEMSKCIRCYACRNVCPSCYCPTCFVEQNQPHWLGVGEDATDTQVFQFMRIFHMVGRCVDCGSCVSVCPMGVDLRKFLKKLDKDAWELFGSRTGSSLDEPPPLSTYKEHDKEEFIYNP
jgi:formate dehydrogenase (coenzyme F420) beta subunit